MNQIEIPESGVMNFKLVCGLRAVVLNDETTVTIHIPSMECTDMAGAINMAKYLNPDVQKVIVMAGDKIDRVYREGSDKWISTRPNP